MVTDGFVDVGEGGEGIVVGVVVTLKEPKSDDSKLLVLEDDDVVLGSSVVEDVVCPAAVFLLRRLRSLPEFKEVLGM